jgi:hypothetical protein
MAVGWPTKTTYANGDVYSASDVNDTNGTLNLAAGAQWAAGKNRIINGNFALNQRNFTSNTTNNSYNFDRFLQANSGGTVTVTPQTFTAGTAPVAGYEAKNFVRIVTASQSAAGDYALYGQKIEDVRTLAGQTATVSFWAKASTGTPKIGATLDQYFGTGGAASATVTSSAATQTITTSWVRYSFTISIPSISGKTIGTDNNSSLSLYIATSVGTTLVAAGYPNTGIQNATIDIWGVQVEQGSTATAFQTATGTIQGELAACQRYYAKSYDIATAPATTTQTGSIAIETADYNGSHWLYIRFPVAMRSAPIVTLYSPTTGTAGQWRIYNQSRSVNADNAMSTTNIGDSGFQVYASFNGSLMIGHYVANGEL